MLSLRRTAQLTSFRRAAKLAAIAGFVVYASWNAWHLASGVVPPSLFSGLTGWPCPTTGCTRSLGALLRGDLRSAMFWNPFAAVFLVLLVVSAGSVLRSRRSSGEFRLHRRVVLAWCSVLGIAWIVKFALGPQWW